MTERGLTMMRKGEAIFDRLRTEWEEQVGTDAVAALEETLKNYVGTNAIRIDTPGWDARDPDA